MGGNRVDGGRLVPGRVRTVLVCGAIAAVAAMIAPGAHARPAAPGATCGSIGNEALPGQAFDIRARRLSCVRARRLVRAAMARRATRCAEAGCPIGWTIRVRKFRCHFAQVSSVTVSQPVECARDRRRVAWQISYD